MKKLIYFIVFVYLFTNIVELKSQTGWKTVFIDTEESHFKTFFIDINTGFAYGYRYFNNTNARKIIKTTNSGLSWADYTNFSNSSGYIACLYFINQNTGFVSVQRSTSNTKDRFMKTVNGGNNWISMIDSTTLHDHYITSVSFINQVTGYAATNNYILYKTTNTGNNWSLIPSNDVPGWFTKIVFTSENIGHTITTSSATWKTSNGGINWNIVYSSHASDIFFPEMSTGYQVYEATIAKTTNSGDNWFGIPHTFIAAHFYTVYFCNTNTGWFGGYGSTVPYPQYNLIYKSTDGGDNFMRQSVDSLNGYIWSIQMIDSSVGYSSGSYKSSSGTEYGIVYKTTTGGVLFANGPMLLSPVNNSFNVSYVPTMIWNSLNYATKYRIQISSDSSFNSTNYDTIVTNTQAVVSSGTLTGFTKYFWRVYGFNILYYNDLEISPWSSVWNFTTTISSPTLVSPANGSSGVTLMPLLDWSDVTGATSYNLQVANNAGFSLPVIDLSSLPSSQYQVPSGILQANTIYYWRASASNSNGTSNWATAWNFTTLASPNTPNLISPTNGSNILTLTPTLDWSDVTGAISYTVQVATDTNFINLAVNQSGLTGSQYLVPTGALTGNTTYYWRARAVNEAGPGPWSVRWYFRVVTIPPAPNLVAPPNNSTNQPPTVILDWDSLASASSYRIQIATDSLFNSMIYDTSGVTRSYLQMRPFILFANVKYFWRINAVNLAGTGPWSFIWNFRVNPTGVYQYSYDLPKEFKLYNNYPNPFNPSTKIRFDLPKNANTKITIYDISGREINQMINEYLSAGGYEISWNANNLASGVYFYRLETESFTDVKRMLLIK